MQVHMAVKAFAAMAAALVGLAFAAILTLADDRHRYRAYDVPGPVLRELPRPDHSAASADGDQVSLAWGQTVLGSISDESRIDTGPGLGEHGDHTHARSGPTLSTRLEQLPDSSDDRPSVPLAIRDVLPAAEHAQRAEQTEEAVAELITASGGRTERDDSGSGAFRIRSLLHACHSSKYVPYPNPEWLSIHDSTGVHSSPV